MSSYPAIAVVILDMGGEMTLDYGIPHELYEKCSRGVQVEVPVRSSRKMGYILDIKTSSEYKSLKPILNIISDVPLITEDLLDLAQWVAKYYCSSLRDIFRMLLPPGVRRGMGEKEQLFVMRAKTRDEIAHYCVEIRQKKPAQAAILDVMLLVKKGILLSQLLEESKGSRSSVLALEKQGYLLVDIVRVDRSPLINEEYFISKPKTLNGDQALALNKIIHSLQSKTFETHLIHGVTGSGKTEVYLQAIDHALQANLGSIMLVPEISLTGQTIERFKSRFHEKIAILHYRLSEGERRDEWHNIHSGQAKIVIGARSAIFSPVKNLGLIIVDEEHENSYKQSDTAPCYQARDVAVMRAKLTKSTVILGSATPSIESYHNALKGKYHLSVLHKRADVATLPDVTIVDMKREFEKAKGFTNFSEKLLGGIEKRQELGEQTILFLNRRGYHTTMVCPSCSESIKCRHCDIPMTFHLGENHLACHLCGYQISPPPRECPSCHNDNPLKFKGVGTELIESSLHAIFPTIRTIRIDADTTRHKGSHQKLLREFGTGKADVLIGTQMIAKGLHFPEVTLVGVLNSDASLNIPDFRGSENVFQLITQVAGRSGRGVTRGEVILQTSLPDNSTILYASKQDYVGFYEEEIGVRELFKYPPFTHIAKIVFSGKNAKQVIEYANIIRDALIPLFSTEYEFHPLIPCGYAKIKDLYRYQFLIRGPSMVPLNRSLSIVKERRPPPHAIKMFVDVDPSSTYF